MKKMDMLKNKIKTNNKFFAFLIIFFVIGIIFGSLFVLVLKSEDKQLTLEYLNNYVNDIKESKLQFLPLLKSSLVSNLLTIITIWLLGISVIGIPIIAFIYFSKAFTIGFTIASIIYNYKFKGIAFILSYIFPHKIINILVFTLLMLYALTLSLKIIKAIFKRQSVDFGAIFSKYLKVFLFCVVLILLTALYEAYVFPKISKFILELVNF